MNEAENPRRERSIMENERDVAFTPSTRVGGIDQGADFTTPASASMSGDGASAGSDSPTTGAAAKAREVAATARERAVEKVQDRINTQKHRATDSLESVAQSLRVAGEQLPETNGMSRYMYQAANQVDNLAAFLNNRELTELVDEVEDFARRQPALFVGGAFALGVLGARFLKSSRRNIDRGPDWGANYTSTPYAAPTRGDLGNTFDSDYPTPGTGSMSGLGSTGGASASDRDLPDSQEPRGSEGRTPDYL